MPFMDHFYDNSIQSAQMRDIAIDFEILGEHLVLLGNQVWLIFETLPLFFFIFVLRRA